VAQHKVGCPLNKCHPGTDRCPARVTFKLVDPNDFDGEWEVVTINMEHNHESKDQGKWRAPKKESQRRSKKAVEAARLLATSCTQVIEGGASADALGGGSQATAGGPHLTPEMRSDPVGSSKKRRHSSAGSDEPLAVDDSPSDSSSRATARKASVPHYSKKRATTTEQQQLESSVEGPTQTQIDALSLDRQWSPSTSRDISQLSSPRSPSSTHNGSVVALYHPQLSSPTSPSLHDSTHDLLHSTSPRRALLLHHDEYEHSTDPMYSAALEIDEDPQLAVEIEKSGSGSSFTSSQKGKGKDVEQREPTRLEPPTEEAAAADSQVFNLGLTLPHDATRSPGAETASSFVRWRVLGSRALTTHAPCFRRLLLRCLSSVIASPLVTPLSQPSPSPRTHSGIAQSSSAANPRPPDTTSSAAPSTSLRRGRKSAPRGWSPSSSIPKSRRASARSSRATWSTIISRRIRAGGALQWSTR
jgi:hypothetical protein